MVTDHASTEVMCSCFFFQVRDYAERKHMSTEEMERWLAPILSYEREDDLMA